jgi:alkanesulfonate monooxygenase SsuD/methylene tetrahydromethanopterin reductase-like flavin-dependent oxidoreductase (luciferase family)
MTRVGIMLPSFDPFRTGEPPRILEAAILAEALQFDAVWVGDHLASPAPVLDGPICLAAAAAVTARVDVGFSVMLLGLRQPAWAAKQLASLQALSGGRLALGVGVGGEFPGEFVAAGVPVSERGRRLDAILAVLGDLLTGAAVDFDDAKVSLRVPALEPALRAPPRLLVGGRSDRALRRAARFGDVWLPMWFTPAELAVRAERLADLAAEHERQCPKLAVLVGVHADTDLRRARREAAGHLQGLYGLPFEVVERWTLIGHVDAVAARLAEYLEIGVEEIILMPLARDPLRQYEQLAPGADQLRSPGSGVSSDRAPAPSVSGTCAERSAPLR